MRKFDKKRLIKIINIMLIVIWMGVVFSFLIMNYAYTINTKTKEKIIGSIVFGAGHAVTDELHQLFVSGRSARIFDVGIDTLGVITGILIYLITRKVIKIIIARLQKTGDIVIG